MATERLRSREIRGIHVLMALIAFFGVVFAVNAVFLYSALQTHTGLVANEPYRKGLAYNERIAADDAQGALGWAGDVRLGQDGVLALALVDRDERPVSALVINALVARPSTSQFDREAVLVEESPGHYVGRLAPLEAGGWIVNMEARRWSADGAEPVIYRLRRREWLKP